MLRFSSASVLLAVGLSACSAGPPEGDRLRVGAAAVDITPSVGGPTPTYLAGFRTNRIAAGVHDPLWARAIVLEKGGRRVTLVSCDVVGLLHGRLGWLTSTVRNAGELIVCSTHSHSGPDTVGLWGPLPLVSGVSGDYLRRLRDAIAEAVQRASQALRPSTLYAAEAMVEGVCKDVRPPDIRHEEAASLVARDDSGRAIAVLVSFAMHPEGMGSGNRLVSSDYPHYLREALERDFPGAVAVFVSGDLGGMQTPDIREHTWEEIRRVGETIAVRVRESLAAAAPVWVPELKVARAPVRFALENPRFIAGFRSGLFGTDSEGVIEREGEAYFLRTEVVAVRLGGVEWVTIPGEAFPEVGREILGLMEAPHRVLIGLGGDEVGYILPKEDFDPKKYEESMSLGPRTAPTLLDALKKLLKGF